MADKRKTMVDNILCINMILAVGILRLVCHSNARISLNSITCILYTTAIFVWMNQVKRRLIHEEERRYLLWMGWMSVGLMMIRTIKFIFLPENHILVRYAWYLYYVPQTFMMLFMLFAVLHIGGRLDEKLPRGYYWLYLPAVLLCIGILTNDFHQLAFRFDEPVAMWQDASTYRHGILYYLSLVWMGLLFAAILVITIRRCTISENRRKIWMPLFPLGIGVVYILLFLQNPGGIFAKMYKTSEMLVIIFPAFMEGLIQAHLFPSNDHYVALWNAASIGGGIMTQTGQICCSSPKCVPVTLEEVIQAQNKDVVLENDHRILRSHPIRGGYGYWTKDVQDIWNLNRQLAETGDIITEENAILAGENRLQQQKERVKQQNVIYDDIADILKHRLRQLKDWIELPYKTETEFKKRMRYACVLNVYLKRYSNMYLLARESRTLPMQELHLAIRETLTYVRYMDVTAYAVCSLEKNGNSSDVLQAYEFFEVVIEEVLADSDAILAVIMETKDGWGLRLEIAAAGIELEKSRYDKMLGLHRADLKIEKEEEAWFLTLTFSEKGGDANAVF